jgi:cytochrome oxidase Cu insertion factor (SCO1/SenC/PrrC family)
MKWIQLLFILIVFISCHQKQPNRTNLISFPVIENDSLSYIDTVPDIELPIPCTREISNKLFKELHQRQLENTLNHRLFNFEFWTLKNEIFSTKEIEGKTALFNFYFTHCAPGGEDIEKGLPILIEKYGTDENVVIVAVFMRASHIDGLKALIKYRISREEKVVFLALKKEDYKHFNTDTSPSRLVVDKNGIVRHYSFGQLNDEILQEIDAIVNSSK